MERTWGVLLRLQETESVEEGIQDATRWMKVWAYIFAYIHILIFEEYIKPSTKNGNLCGGGILSSVYLLILFDTV